MKFELLNKKEKIRWGRIHTRKGIIETPVFMPVGTQGTVKAMNTPEMERIGAQIILGNTYHLYLRPGTEILDTFGGLHNFMRWDKPILTDSGGYQVFSLGSKLQNCNIMENLDGAASDDVSLVKITEEGAIFKSHIDGSKHLFAPEKVIDIQLSIGSDIMMPLDYCPSAEATDGEIEKAVDQTSRWFERTWRHFQKRIVENGWSDDERPALFAIIQGGAKERLRKKSYEFLSQFAVDGFSIGGVANAGESKLKQRRALEYTLPLIPDDKPRYLMGVGEPEDMIGAISQGVDMFDCVLPTRLARHGTAWVFANQDNDLLKGEWGFGKIDFRKSILKGDKDPIDALCDCEACRHYSKAYIHHLFKAKEILGIRLLTEHNLRFVLKIFDEIRADLGESVVEKGKTI